MICRFYETKQGCQEGVKSNISFALTHGDGGRGLSYLPLVGRLELKVCDQGADLDARQTRRKALNGVDAR